VSWTIVLDEDLCQGHGVCESEAPDVFTVSRDGVLTILDTRPPDDLRGAVELAVRHCPTHAIRITEE